MMKDIARGAAWMIAFRFAERALGFISLLILARLLIPADFGIVAMAMSVVALIELAGAFGFDVALIQHPDPQREHFDTVFTLNVLVGVGGGIALALLAHPAAAFFHEPRLVEVMWVLAGAWAVQALENVGTVMFRREMQFDREFRFLAGKRVLGFVATLIAAFMLRSYWALVIGIVVGRLAAVALSFAMHPYRPAFSLSAVRQLLSFSFWLFLVNIAGFLILRLSTFVVGRYAGTRDLGHYTVAYEIGTLPTSELLAPINRAIIPGFARVADDSASLRSGFLEVMGATTVFAIPAAFGIAAIADPLVRILLTEKWIEIVPLLQVLGFLGAVAAILSSAFPAFYALGRPKIAVYILGVRLVLVVPAMLFATAEFGAIGAAWADLATALLALPIGILVACRVLAVPPFELLRRFWRPLLASMAMYALVRGMLKLPEPAVASVWMFVATIATGVLAYAGVLMLLWRISGQEAGIESRLLALASRRNS